MEAHGATHTDSIDLPPANVLTLAALAVAHSQYPWLDFRDPLAERVWRWLGADASRVSDVDLRAALGRSLEIDKFARRWARGRGDGRIVEVGAGLSTRHARMDPAALSLTAIDRTPLARVRREVFPAPRAFQQIEAALEGRGWVRALARRSGALFVIIEDAFLDRRSCDVIAALSSLVADLPRGSVIAASHGGRARFVVANPGARRASLEVRIFGDDRREEIVRFPRLRWMIAPSPLDGIELPAVALLEAV